MSSSEEYNREKAIDELVRLNQELRLYDLPLSIDIEEIVKGLKEAASDPERTEEMKEWEACDLDGLEDCVWEPDINSNTSLSE